MSKRRILRLVILAVIMACLVFAAWPKSPLPPPPIVSVISVEPIDLTDVSGTKQLLVTFTITNQSGVFLKDVGNIIETQINGEWSGARGTMAGDVSFQRQMSGPLLFIGDGLFLVPANATACRFSLKYASGVTNLSSRIASSILPRLPSGVRRSFSRRFGVKWFYLQTEPDRWRKLTVELAIPPNQERISVSAQP